jgi:hypothetical protein
MGNRLRYGTVMAIFAALSALPAAAEECSDEALAAMCQQHQFWRVSSCSEAHKGPGYSHPDAQCICHAPCGTSGRALDRAEPPRTMRESLRPKHYDANKLQIQLVRASIGRSTIDITPILLADPDIVREIEAICRSACAGNERRSWLHAATIEIAPDAAIRPARCT